MWCLVFPYTGLLLVALRMGESMYRRALDERRANCMVLSSNVIELTPRMLTTNAALRLIEDLANVNDIRDSAEKCGAYVACLERARILADRLHRCRARKAS